MWAFILCCISILGIVALVAGKHWERRRGTVPGSALRNFIDAKVVFAATKIQGVPDMARGHARGLTKELIFHLSAALLRLVQFVERKLIRIINLVKGRRDINTKKGSASFFLQNVSTYKDQQPTVGE